ncbi:MAG: hypothetical protein C4308_02660 [Chitinophagaceae bacterium]
MLTEEEKRFLDYWEHNRLYKKKVIKQLSVGLPLGVALALAIFVNVFSGWDKRAQMLINAEPSLVLIMVVAAVLIIIFIVVFSVKHNWDLNEQRYRELLARRNNLEH